MLHSKLLTGSAVALVAAGAVAVGTAGLATPTVGVTPETLVTATLKDIALVNHDRVKLQTKGDVAVRVQRLTFGAGGTTGWHHHPGAVIVAIASGSVTLREENCGVSTTYGPGLPAGSVFVEGHDESHVATSAQGAVVYATYIDPSATFRVDEPSPCS